MPIPIRRALLISFFLALTTNCRAADVRNEDITGYWFGPLQLGPIELRLVFHITANGDTLSATFDSLDQGQKDLPIAQTTFLNNTLHLNMPPYHASFDGRLNAVGPEITGQWKQAARTTPLTLKKSEKYPPFKRSRPQEPKKPYPYEELQVSFENTSAKQPLAGTLTKPRGNGPFPALLLITGSGFQDRDSTLAEHKPFWILADYLTRRGLAVLRVDDRGVGGSRNAVQTLLGGAKEPSITDNADDAMAGFVYLKTRKDIDPKRIGLLGHSEGGYIAPMVAVRDPQVSFVVLWAGPGVSGEEVAVLQVQQQLRVWGASENLLAWQERIHARLFALMKTETDNQAFVKKAWQVIDEEQTQLDEKDRKAAETYKGLNQLLVQQLLSPWTRSRLAYDPRPTLRQLRCPVLAVIGEKDLQVPPSENLAAIQQALTAGGNTNFSIKQLPGLNHIFQTAPTGLVGEYPLIRETIAPAALETTADWITRQVGK